MALFKKPFSKRFLIKDDDTIFLLLINGSGLITLKLNSFSQFISRLTSPSLLFPNLKLLLTKINLELNFLFKISEIKFSALVFENFLSNFFVITKSTFKLLSNLIFFSIFFQ